MKETTDSLLVDAAAELRKQIDKRGAEKKPVLYVQVFIQPIGVTPERPKPGMWIPWIGSRACELDLRIISHRAMRDYGWFGQREPRMVHIYHFDQDTEMNQANDHPLTCQFTSFKLTEN